MPYYRCPSCGLSAHNVAGHLTANTCPNCSCPLADSDRIDVGGSGPTALSRRFVPEPHAAPAARRALETLSWELADDEVDVASLLTTELIANSVEHSEADAGSTVRLDVLVAADVIRIEVRDDGPGFVPAARTADSPLDSHWGLHLVDQLADRWQTEPGPQTLVWFELDRDALAPAFGPT